jgi:predicted DNA-binding transcriptional regulator AlpA
MYFVEGDLRAMEPTDINLIPPPDTGRRFLRKTSVALRYDCNVQTVDRMVRDGRLPKPYYHGGKRFPRWAIDELDKADRVVARRIERSARERAGHLVRDEKNRQLLKAKARKPRRSRAAAAATV